MLAAMQDGIFHCRTRRSNTWAGALRYRCCNAEHQKAHASSVPRCLTFSMMAPTQTHRDYVIMSNKEWRGTIYAPLPCLGFTRHESLGWTVYCSCMLHDVEWHEAHQVKHGEFMFKVAVYVLSSCL